MSTFSTTKLVFSCLPRDAGSADLPARVTIMVSPRLQDLPNARVRLSDFALGVWPAVVRTMAMSIKIGETVWPATLAPPRAGEQLDDQLWGDLFPSTTRVKPYQPDPPSRTIKGYPVAQLARDVHNLYAGVTAGSSNAPQVFAGLSGPDASPVTPLDIAIADLGAVRRALFPSAGPLADAQLDAILGGRGPERDTFVRAMYDANSFFARGTDAGTRPRPTTPSLDFHQQVGALGDHQLLLYRLGLAFDVLLPHAALGVGGAMRFVTAWRGAPSDHDVCPRTRYLVDSGRLLAQPRSGDVDGGYLPLQAFDGFGPIYEIVQLDTDGAAIQTVDYVGTIFDARTDTSGAPAGTDALPTLRSAGLSIVHRDRGSWLTERLSRADVLHDFFIVAGGHGDHTDDHDLWAEDLVRGWRIDVETDGGPWRSLCARAGSIDVAGRAFTVEPGEGYVKAATATSTGKEGDTDLYLHEAIAGWDGWSLVARRPGKQIWFDPETKREVIQDQDNAPAGGLDIQAEYQVIPGTLPKLRYGRSYRLRARAVDLAGHSLPLADADDVHASAPVIYRRYEPVSPPVPVPQRRFAEGESIENLVIRTGDTGTSGPCVRHLLPPKGTLATAETHGRLDGALGPGAPAGLWYALAAKEKGTLFDARCADLINGGTIRTGLTPVKPATAVPEEPAAKVPPRGAPPASGMYMICSADHVELPWLPDPMARGYTLLDPATGDWAAVDYASQAVPLSPTLADWPIKVSGRLELIDGGLGEVGAPAAGTDVIQVAVPQGRKVTMRYSSLPEAALDQLALAHHEPGVDAPIQGAHLAMSRGLHIAVTPGRPITFVHAVQRPVVGPTLDAMTLSRQAGDTFVGLEGDAAVHGWSTSHVDVQASWYEWFEDPDSKDGLRMEPRNVTIGRVAVADGAAAVPLVREDSATDRLPDISTGGVPYVIAEASVSVTATRRLRHELGDTRHRTVGYTALGTTRYQEYFPAKLIQRPDQLQRAGAQAVRNARSAARPEPPSVQYVVPTFKWEDPAADGSRKRAGRGLRIYLDRPWFQSGEFERLGVLCAPFDDVGVEGISAWGADPVWMTDPPQAMLTDALIRGEEVTTYRSGGRDFSAARVMTRDVVVDGVRAKVVGYLPEWDRASRRWFVDVELAADGAYWPFIRLVVVRWQPDSVGVETSTAVTLDFAQLAPDRTVSVVRAGTRVDVTLTGVSSGNNYELLTHDAGPAAHVFKGPTYHGDTIAAAHRVSARVESRPAASTGDLTWSQVGAATELTATWIPPTNEVRWSGRVTLSGGGQYRVVVSEAEVFDSDTGAPMDPAPANARARGREVFLYQQRV